MEIQTEADTIVVAPEDGHTVYVEDFHETKYGTKAVLGGDTYELLSSKGEGLADELDFDEHHCAFDWDLEKWTIDPDRESLDALADVLEGNGHELGGLAARVIEELEALPDTDHKYWESRGVTVRVVYDHPRSDGKSVKEGVVHSVDHKQGFVQIKREDHVINRLSGDSLYAPSSDYPYMGDVEAVEIEP